MTKGYPYCTNPRPPCSTPNLPPVAPQPRAVQHPQASHPTRQQHRPPRPQLLAPSGVLPALQDQQTPSESTQPRVYPTVDGGCPCFMEQAQPILEEDAAPATMPHASRPLDAYPPIPAPVGAGGARPPQEGTSSESWRRAGLDASCLRRTRAAPSTPATQSCPGAVSPSTGPQPPGTSSCRQPQRRVSCPASTYPPTNAPRKSRRGTAPAGSAAQEPGPASATRSQAPTRRTASPAPAPLEPEPPRGVSAHT